VGADDRDTAIKAVMHVVGADVVVTSSMKISDGASEIAALQPGEIKQI